ncbi:MAG: fluoride efflux transporter CrcB [Chitinophagaceae bacterium]|nr:fluoride efflux transporter CrcB [Chitinophagaceae bacterium]
MLKHLLLIGMGGGLGSVARYLTQKWFAEHADTVFPWGTLAVNLLGCFMIGALSELAEKSAWLSPPVRLMLTAGFCGGFTTFSAFSFENMILLKSGNVLYLLLYVFGSVLLGLLAVLGGIMFVKLI